MDPRDSPPGAAPSLSEADLSHLIRALYIDVLALTEIAVPRGHRAEMGSIDAPAIHYNLGGEGWLSIDGGPLRPLTPHLLVIVPPNTPFAIEVDGGELRRKVFDQHCWRRDAASGVLRAGVPGERPEVVLICGFFNASFGPAIGLFRELRSPIVEQFTARDRIDEKLQEAMGELRQQAVGVGEMTASLLKQVIISLIRRSLSSSQSWTERFAILRDPQIARAFAEMAARPGATHTAHSLARVAGMSRSAFMARFVAVLGRPPMAVLRDLRMRQAALDLATTSAPVEIVAQNAGYESRSSFVRAFKSAFGEDPTRYRATLVSRPNRADS